MVVELQKGIIDIVASGKDTHELKNKLMQYLNDDVSKAYSSASRLARTELSYVQTQAALDRYEEAHIQFYKVLPALDACEECIDYNEIFRIDEAIPSVNCPPFHPNCRCTIIPVIGGKQ